ncbi:MAG: hypothetical protein LUD72_11295 [Bacteroidales bacterium]|nr:hypothetical protein [Bacteroidales bacterium]
MTAEETLAKIKTLFERDEAMQTEFLGPGYWECPSCRMNTTGEWLEHGMKFCPNCGQRLAWWKEARE